MRHATIVVKAEWDEEASVWVATSNDIAGLAVEANTFEELNKKIPDVLCDLIELNGIEGDGMPDIPYHIMASQIGRISNPCN